MVECDEKIEYRTRTADKNEERPSFSFSPLHTHKLSKHTKQNTIKSEQKRTNCGNKMMYNLHCRRRQKKAKKSTMNLVCVC